MEKLIKESLKNLNPQSIEVAQSNAQEVQEAYQNFNTSRPLKMVAYDNL